MSTGLPVRQGTPSTGTGSRRSNKSNRSRPIQPPPATFTPDNADQGFGPCAATASFLLYAQRSVVLVLHHDTLAIERRFELHREDVLWVHADNTSERGFGRLAVSYDAGNTAIVWDILTGGEVARFSAYEHMRIACFMRNGNIAFGNDQGNIILFEPSTSEHISARTIFDPVTALAPSFDCRTFAIGYLNGSILVTTLQPSFTILHTLITNRAPAQITGLAWHGSSSKQKTDMLATQTADGDLRVWSVPKVPHQDLQPTIIRVLQRAELRPPGPCWFAWSKNGRIVQHAEGETRAWDVRTKRVTFEVIPTIDDVTAMAVYGPTATLFTLGRNHTAQQYDIQPNKEPVQVASVQHVPAITPPTPPTDLDLAVANRKGTYRPPATLPTVAPSTGTASSTDESGALSPLQKIAQEMDTLEALESEIRDKVMPLSPSSKTSSLSSRSSRDSRRNRRYLYDQPESSRASTAGMTGTEFSTGEPVKHVGHESVSIRSVSSFASKSQHARSSSLRKQVMRSPDETTRHHAMDLFPYTKARLREVDFRTPHYGDGPRTAELLQREMLSTVFGWNEDIETLLREEISRHRAGSANVVLLSKWLGDVGADSMASMVGSESMTSSDWMLLALSSIGKDSQKKVGEAFVQRLLEKGDIHPAVAILLGLQEYNDAIEVYVSQSFFMEALLLACLQFPNEWKRQSYLLRKWGEQAVQQGQAELAVRCFSCAASETSGAWFSPRAQQEAAFAAQEQSTRESTSAEVATSPPLSPPSRSGSLKFQARNASLKLITTFGEKASLNPPANSQIGTTPIAESAVTPGGMWRQPRQRTYRDPSSARTATPGDFSKRKRLPSRGEIERAKQEAADMELVTPMTASQDFAPGLPAARPRSRTSNASSLPEPATALRATTYDPGKLIPGGLDSNRLPSPVPNLTARLRGGSRDAVERRAGTLAVEIVQTRYTESASPGLAASNRVDSLHSPSTNNSNRVDNLSPSLTDKSGKTRAIDDYISSVEQARNKARRERAHSRKRGDSRKRDESRGGRGSSRTRELSTTRGGDNVRYIKPAKRSPASPVPMSPEEIAQAGQRAKSEPATTDDEDFYKIASPIASPVDGYRSPIMSRPESRQPRLTRRESSRNRMQVPEDNSRGRTDARGLGGLERSPSLPLPTSPEKHIIGETDDTESDGKRFRIRAGSSSQQLEDLQSRRAASRGDRSRSAERGTESKHRETVTFMLPEFDMLRESVNEDQSSVSSISTTSEARRRPYGKSRKELAAQELEDRRLSLARRPSAPQIPLPAELHYLSTRPGLAPRSQTDLGDSPSSSQPPLLGRSQTVNPELMMRPTPGGRAGAMLPPIGLPATPRAMRHPRYMGADVNERVLNPPVPEIPGSYSEVSSAGGAFTASSLSHETESNMESNMSGLSSIFAHQPSYLTQPSNLSSYPSVLSSQQSAISSQQSYLSSQSGGGRQYDDIDDVGPLLPASVFGQNAVPPPRAASVPVENNSGVHPAYKANLPPTRRLSQMRGHVRKISPPDDPASPTATGSIDETIRKIDQVVVVSESTVTTEISEPPILPELQHLAGPPPPPSIPTMYATASQVSSDVISIAMDGNSALETSPTLPATTYSTFNAPIYPQPMERASTSSPTAHRRGRGSVSETFGSRFRGVTDRMRSQSRTRGTKSPPMGSQQTAVPYETVLPPMPGPHSRRESMSGARAKSPYEQAMTAGGQDQQISGPPPLPPVSPATQEKLNETSIPPTHLPSSRSASTSGYRNPKEIRANMPPQTLQQGVYNGGFL